MKTTKYKQILKIEFTSNKLWFPVETINAIKRKDENAEFHHIDILANEVIKHEGN